MRKATTHKRFMKNLLISSRIYRNNNKKMKEVEN